MSVQLCFNLNRIHDSVGKALRTANPGGVTFSYPEPFLRAVRRGALATSKTGYHKNMVKDISGIRTITFVVANQMPV
jgi:hypothetical protein